VHLYRDPGRAQEGIASNPARTGCKLEFTFRLEKKIKKGIESFEEFRKKRSRERFKGLEQNLPRMLHDARRNPSEEGGEDRVRGLARRLGKI